VAAAQNIFTNCPLAAVTAQSSSVGALACDIGRSRQHRRRILELGARHARRTAILVDGAWLLAGVRGLCADAVTSPSLWAQARSVVHSPAKVQTNFGRVAGVVLRAIEIDVALA